MAEEIKNEEEYFRILKVIYSMMDIQEMTEEQSYKFDYLVTLVEEYEKKNFDFD